MTFLVYDVYKCRSSSVNLNMSFPKSQDPSIKGAAPTDVLDIMVACILGFLGVLLAVVFL